MDSSPVLPMCRSPISAKVRRSHSFVMWKELATTTTALDIAKDCPEVVFVESCDTGHHALEILSQRRALAIAVLDSSKKLAGFIDVLDILHCILHFWTTQTLSFKIGMIKDISLSRLLNIQVSNIANFSHSNVPIKVKETSSIQEIFATISNECHHSRPAQIGVVNSSDQVTNILNMTDILAFVANVLPLRSTLKMLDLIRVPLAINLDVSFAAAIRLLSDNRINGLAITDNEGRLIGCLCPSDFVAIGPATISKGLFESTLRTLYATRTLVLKEPVLCTENSTIHQVVNTMYNKKIQRLHVVDSSRRPIGLVTVHDIFHVLKAD